MTSTTPQTACSSARRPRPGGDFRRALIAIPFLFFGGAAMAAPVELDGPNWHAVVIRPVDLWVGDASVREDSLEAVRKGDVNYTLTERGQWLLGGGYILQGPSDHPIVRAVQEEAKRVGMRTSRSQRYQFDVSDRLPLPADSYRDFAALQERFYREQVRREGDPETLEGRVKSKKFMGALLSLAALGLAGKAGGTSGSLGMGQSQLLGNVYQLPNKAAEYALPVVLPKLEAGDFQTVVVRRVQFKAGMNGQIVIALKPGATDADETDALVKCIAVAAGAGTTPAGIEKSRQEDFAQRQAVWKELQQQQIQSTSSAPVTSSPAAAASGTASAASSADGGAR